MLFCDVHFLYNILIFFIDLLLPITAIFNPKMKLFVNGRKSTFQTITSKINPSDQVIWIHCASLGEFEQGRPIIKNFQITKLFLLSFLLQAMKSEKIMNTPM